MGKILLPAGEGSFSLANKDKSGSTARGAITPVYAANGAAAYPPNSAAAGLDALKRIITELTTSTECLLLGAPLDTPTGDTRRYASKKALANNSVLGEGGVIARSLEHIGTVEGRAFAMIDVDDAGADTPTPEEAIALLEEAVPEASGAACLVVPSSKSCIAGADGKELAGLRGYHLYFELARGADLPLIGERLKAHFPARAEITKGGSRVERWWFDASVFSPERLDFAGQRILWGGLRDTPGKEPWLLRPEGGDIAPLRDLDLPCADDDRPTDDDGSPAPDTRSASAQLQRRKSVKGDRAVRQAKKRRPHDGPPLIIGEALKASVMSALACIPSNVKRNEGWFGVACALRAYGAEGFEIFRAWSQRDGGGDDDGKLAYTWSSLEDTREVTLDTIFWLAREIGGMSSPARLEPTVPVLMLAQAEALLQATLDKPVAQGQVRLIQTSTSLGKSTLIENKIREALKIKKPLFVKASLITEALRFKKAGAYYRHGRDAENCIGAASGTAVLHQCCDVAAFRLRDTSQSLGESACHNGNCPVGTARAKRKENPVDLAHWDSCYLDDCEYARTELVIVVVNPIEDDFWYLDGEKKVPREVITDESVELFQADSIKHEELVAQRGACIAALGVLDISLRHGPETPKDRDARALLEQGSELLTRLMTLRPGARLTGLFDDLPAISGWKKKAAPWERTSWRYGGGVEFSTLLASPQRFLRTLLDNLPTALVSDDGSILYSCPTPLGEVVAARTHGITMVDATPTPAMKAVATETVQIFLERPAAQVDDTETWAKGATDASETKKMATVALLSERLAAVPIVNTKARARHLAELTGNEEGIAAFALMECDPEYAASQATEDLAAAGACYSARHGKAHNHLSGKNLLAVGSRRLPPKATRAAYDLHRAAMRGLGIELEDWKGDMRRWLRPGFRGVLPTCTDARDWLIDEDLRASVQVDGRSRSARTGATTTFLGGLPKDGMVNYGIPVERVQLSPPTSAEVDRLVTAAEKRIAQNLPISKSALQTATGVCNNAAYSVFCEQFGARFAPHFVEHGQAVPLLERIRQRMESVGGRFAAKFGAIVERLLDASIRLGVAPRHASIDVAQGDEFLLAAAVAALYGTGPPT